jgi:glycosyltransferase involved in cell wall biosynthesis
MWTKNGAKTLRPVLSRINKVVPEEAVNQRIIVDDRSSDETRSIGKECGWEVVFNKGTGISDGANTALNLVETACFCSFEQDLLLAPEWWESMHKLILNPKVAAASGLRFCPEQNPVSKIELHAYLAETSKLSGNLISLNQSRWGRTLDNTIYNTALIRELGGFPKVNISGVDALLAWIIKTRGYDWLVDATIQSLHLRSGFKDSLDHQYTYSRTYTELYRRAKQLTGVDYPIIVNPRILVKRLVRSPMVALMLSVKYREPRLAIYFPFFQIWDLGGFLRGRAGQQSD